MSADDTKKPKVEKEQVLTAHQDGTPHVTVDQQGLLHHYARGCEAARRQRLEARTGITSSGPAKVTSDAYRSGWDNINWGSKPGAA